jgi:hypothetical protein
MNQHELRKKYPVFRYESFSVNVSDDEIRIGFQFSAPPDITFNPEIVLSPAPDVSRIAASTLDNLAFHLGMIEMVSYWKATASPLIEVLAGVLSTSQCEWWQDLFLNGMGEFFFKNSIDFTASHFLRIVSGNKSRRLTRYDGTLQKRSLLPVGGGRDSAVTGRLFREACVPFNCMMLNPTPAALKVAASLNCESPIIVQRQIQPRLLELNELGYLNGHTPFSAYLAFLNAMCLVLYDYAEVIIANERSSEEANIFYRGRSINHQYSKTYRFERRFDGYMRRYLVRNGRYRSFIRSLYELQMGLVFSLFPDVFGLPRSCNRQQKEGTWCGECAKCLSVFITTYPFVEPYDLQKIFGRDFFEDVGCAAVLEELAGLRDCKPFECVNTISETVAALILCSAKAKRLKTTLPPLLRHVDNFILPAIKVETIQAANDLIKHLDPRPRLPFRFRQLLDGGRISDEKLCSLIT